MSAEQTEQNHPTAEQPASLRNYWLEGASSPPTRRTALSEPASPLFAETGQLSLSAETPKQPHIGASQPALPLTWYGAEHDDTAQGAGSPSLHTLQRTIEERGVQTLSNMDLLTLVLRTGAGREEMVRQMHFLLTSYSVQELLSVEFGEFSRQHGLGTAKAAQLQAMLEFSRRLTIPSSEEKYTIRSPRDAAMLVMPDMAFLDHEELRVLVLNTKNQVVANIRKYEGTVNSSVLRPAEIFRHAISRNCPHIVLCHNHPSGDPEPSPEDIEVTQQLVAAGKALDIDLLDHLVIGHNNRFISLKERMMW